MTLTGLAASTGSTSSGGAAADATSHGAGRNGARRGASGSRWMSPRRYGRLRRRDEARTRSPRRAAFADRRTGPPLVVLSGLSAAHTNPSGLDGWMQLRMIRPLAHRFTVHLVNRRPGLAIGTTMRDLAGAQTVALPREEPRRRAQPSTGAALPPASRNAGSSPAAHSRPKAVAATTSSSSSTRAKPR